MEYLYLNTDRMKRRSDCPKGECNLTGANADELRLIRYEKCRKQKKIIDIVIGICLVSAIVLTFAGIDSGLFSVISMAAGIFAIYYRNWRVTAIVTAVVGILLIFGLNGDLGFIQLFTLIVALICDFFWSKLKAQEGFPMFILIEKRLNTSQKAKTYTARKNAVESGIRAAASDINANSDMQDLFDETPDALNADLKGYQERSLNADPLVHAAERHSDIMDVLEEL